MLIAMISSFTSSLLHPLRGKFPLPLPFSSSSPSSSQSSSSSPFLIVSTSYHSLSQLTLNHSYHSLSPSSFQSSSILFLSSLPLPLASSSSFSSSLFFRPPSPPSLSLPLFSISSRSFGSPAFVSRVSARKSSVSTAKKEERALKNRNSNGFRMSKRKNAASIIVNSLTGGPMGMKTIGKKPKEKSNVVGENEKKVESANGEQKENPNGAETSPPTPSESSDTTSPSSSPSSSPSPSPSVSLSPTPSPSDFPPSLLSTPRLHILSILGQFGPLSRPEILAQILSTRKSKYDLSSTWCKSGTHLANVLKTMMKFGEVTLVPGGQDNAYYLYRVVTPLERKKQHEEANKEARDKKMKETAEKAIRHKKLMDKHDVRREGYEKIRELRKKRIGGFNVKIPGDNGWTRPGGPR